jgi:hypothetical protein
MSMAGTVQVDYPKPIELEIPVNGSKQSVPEQYSLLRVLLRMQTRIEDVANGNVGYKGPINAGANIIYNVINSPSPTSGEALSYATAVTLFGGAAMQTILSSAGGFPLNVGGLRGRLADPQPTGIPVVTSLPDPTTTLPDSVVIYGTKLYYLDASVEPGTWKAIAAIGVIQFGLRSAKPAAGNPGYQYFETDTQAAYVDNGSHWIFEAGVAYGTNAARLALTISTYDSGLLWLASDTLRLWRVVAGAWADVTPTAATAATRAFSLMISGA